MLYIVIGVLFIHMYIYKHVLNIYIYYVLYICQIKRIYIYMLYLKICYIYVIYTYSVLYGASNIIYIYMLYICYIYILYCYIIILICHALNSDLETSTSGIFEQPIKIEVGKSSNLF
jgi:hypothetical protein